MVKWMRRCPLTSLALLAVILLTSCTGGNGETRNGDTGNAALADRVAQLEREVKRLRAEVAELRGSSDPERVEVVAGARSCALDLARALEAYRTDNKRYPPAASITVPGSCSGLRVDWEALKENQYAFVVRDERGEVLTRQAGE